MSHTNLMSLRDEEKMYSNELASILKYVQRNYCTLRGNCKCGNIQQTAYGGWQKIMTNK